jgi:hypothetical protein
MSDIKRNLESIKKIFMSDASLDMLCDFERVLDNMDFYAFPNWRLGELVEGPKVSKYWVQCTFMWPKDRMPDPAAAKRLLPYGARITYEKKKIKVPVKIESPADYRPGSKKGKLVDFPVWYVEMMLPKKLMSDIKQGSVDIAGEEVDLSDLQNSMEKGLTDQSATTQQQGQPQPNTPQQPQVPVQGGGPNAAQAGAPPPTF